MEEDYLGRGGASDRRVDESVLGLVGQCFMKQPEAGINVSFDSELRALWLLLLGFVGQNLLFTFSVTKEMRSLS